MCCNLSSIVCLLSLTLILLLVGVKLSSQEIECEINKDPVIFSIQAVPKSSLYKLVLTTEMTDIGNVRFIHVVFREGGGKISVIWLK